MTYTTPPATGGAMTGPHDTENGPLALYGYYPLYNTEEVAKGVGDGSAHVHIFDGETYYMPNGIPNFHGNWPNNNPPEQEPGVPPGWGPNTGKFTEINFPLKIKEEAGYIHYEEANDTYYRWDGVKWDPWRDYGNVDREHWTRVPKVELLHPTDPDDYIQVNGVKDEWIEYLP